MHVAFAYGARFGICDCAGKASLACHLITVFAMWLLLVHTQRAGDKSILWSTSRSMEGYLEATWRRCCYPHTDCQVKLR